MVGEEWGDLALSRERKRRNPASARAIRAREMIASFVREMALESRHIARLGEMEDGRTTWRWLLTVTAIWPYKSLSLAFPEAVGLLKCPTTKVFIKAITSYR
jgi:hypothetical protein